MSGDDLGDVDVAACAGHEQGNQGQRDERQARDNLRVAKNRRLARAILHRSDCGFCLVTSRSPRNCPHGVHVTIERDPLKLGRPQTTGTRNETPALPKVSKRPGGGKFGGGPRDNVKGQCCSYQSRVNDKVAVGKMAAFAKDHIAGHTGAVAKQNMDDVSPSVFPSERRRKRKKMQDVGAQEASLVIDEVLTHWDNAAVIRGI